MAQLFSIDESTLGIGAGGGGLTTTSASGPDKP